MSGDPTSPPPCPDPEEFEPWVNAYASGPLPPDQERYVVEHLQECSSCRQEYAEALKFFQLYYSAFPPKVSPEQVERVKAGVFRRIRRRERIRKLVWASAVAAGTVLVVWSASVLSPQRSQPALVAKDLGETQQPEQEIAVDDSGQPTQDEHVAETKGRPERSSDDGPAGQATVAQKDAQEPAAHEKEKPDPYAGLSPTQTYGRIWQGSTTLVYSQKRLTPEQREELAGHASYLEALLSKESVSPAAWNHLVRMLEKLGDLEAADHAFEGYVESLAETGKDAAVVEALAERGDRLLRQGAAMQAVKHYSRVINEYPNAPGSERAWYGLGNYYLQVGDTAQAKQYFQHVCEDYEYREGLVRDAHYTHSNLAANSGNQEEAINTMHSLLEKSSYIGSRAYAQLRLGDFYRYQKKAAKAIQAYRKALREYSTVACVQTQASNTLERMQQAVLDGALP